MEIVSIGRFCLNNMINSYQKIINPLICQSGNLFKKIRILLLVKAERRIYVYWPLMDYSIKKAIKQSAAQTKLTEEQGCNILNNILEVIHNISEKDAVVDMKEIKLELKKGKLVSISCEAEPTALLSVKRKQDSYIITLQNGNTMQEGSEDYLLEIRIAVVA